MRYFSIDELILKTCSKKFHRLWVLNHATKREIVQTYQDLCRIYLDEYPAQKELRYNYFQTYKKQSLYFFNRWLRRL